MLERTEVYKPSHDCLLKEISAATTQFDVLRFLKKTTELYRSRAFIVLKVPNRTASALQSVSVINSWPSELLSRYDAEGLFHDSPTIAQIRSSTLPFSYEIAKLNEKRSPEKKTKIIELSEKFGMSRGAYFPVCDPGGERGSVGFSGSREPFTAAEMLELHMISTFAFDRLYKISSPGQRAGDDLTQREIDCLNWTAAGKTSLEISNILSLSEHTVNHYLNRAAKKLDAVNRTQAVAKAMRMGIIS
ncbi:LuxR family transcriptional regulator [Rhizobium sp. KVB221]|uniref:LuxR family transcriptional regulator n=1 Tax=Rhizobium setariae TaxID=2801340 RepID=A0A936YL52_9HYPH|nr:LuxR family transcriptional regulator [Rhizobium setariae]MBL0370742.1 LuxR family transcriptional regulator [Rhizobium setariae]